MNCVFYGLSSSKKEKYFSCIFSRVHATLHPALSVGQSVSRSVSWSVTLYFFHDIYFSTSLLLPKWSSDLKCGPCPPTRDLGSGVSGLVQVKSCIYRLKTYKKSAINMDTVATQMLLPQKVCMKEFFKGNNKNS